MVFDRRPHPQEVLKGEFYRRPDVLEVARELLGKGLFTRSDDGTLVGGIIVETEGYAGVSDRACHAYNHRRTKRTEVMYGDGGVAYVYKCYGLHHLLNAVTNVGGVPEAVLIRALVPTHGVEVMRQRRRNRNPLTSGPGTLCQALGITVAHNNTSLNGKSLFIADCGVQFREDEIEATPRIGVDYAGEDAKLPYRFVVKNNVVERNITILV